MSVNIKKRSKARRFAMQALYSWLLSNNDLHDVEKYYLADRNNSKFDVEYFKQLLHEIPKNLNTIDAKFIEYSSRSLDQLDPIELSILRIATYEIMFCQDLPFQVVISEALSLASMFGSEDSYKFVNAVLDRMVKAA